MNRTQIYLDDKQTARLDERAAAEGISRSAVIRRAISIYLAQEEENAAAWRGQWRKVVMASAGRAPYLEEGTVYVNAARGPDSKRLSQPDR